MEPDRYATVLVSLVSNPCDMAIVREEHWYRIPLAKAPRRGVNASILAFYQTKAFGDEKWTIRYWAPTLSWEILPRRQLLPGQPDHPRANELYYKVSLGNLRSLPHPIASRNWHRITFIVTHWGRLESAYEINELLHGSIWEERLWKALRKIGRLAEEEDPDGW